MIQVVGTNSRVSRGLALVLGLSSLVACQREDAGMADA